MVNLLVTNTAVSGWGIAWPNGMTRPSTSMMQYRANTHRVITEIVPLGTNGKMNILPYTGPVDILVDVVGYFKAGTSGQKFHTMPISRLVDTRTTGAVTSGKTFTIAQGNAVVARNPTLVIGMTEVGATSSGWMTAWTGDATRPGVTSLIFGTGFAVNNSALVPTGPTGTFHLLTGATSTHVIVERLGYFSD